MLEILNSDYVILYFFLVAFALIFYLLKKENLFVFLSLILLILIAGLRPLYVGADTIEYKRIFLNPEIYTSEIEIGYLYLIYFSRILNLDYQSFLILNSIIIFLGFGIFITFQSKFKISSFFILFSMFFLPSMNLLRQWISMAFGINVFNKRENIFLDFSLVFLSSSFHITGIIFIIIIINKYFSRRIILISIFLVSSFLILTLSPFFISLIQDYLPSSFLRYFTDPYFLGDGSFSIKTLIYFLILLLYTYVYRTQYYLVIKYLSKKSLAITLISAAIISFVFSFSGQSYYMLHRFGYTLNLLFVLIIPVVLKSILKRNILINFVTVLLMFAMLILNLISDNNKVLDYDFLMAILN